MPYIPTEVPRISLNVFYYPKRDIFAQLNDPGNADPVAAVITKVFAPPPIVGTTEVLQVNLMIFPDLQKPDYRERVKHQNDADETTDEPYFKYMSDPEDD